MQMFLDEEELKQLTGKKRKSSQIRELRFMGIEHRVRSDDSIAVLKEHVQNSFGISHAPTPMDRVFEPDWGALNA